MASAFRPSLCTRTWPTVSSTVLSGRTNCPGRTLPRGASDLCCVSTASDNKPPAAAVAAPPAAGGAFQLAEVVDLGALERRYLDWARGQPGNDLATLARRLGISQRTLYRKLQAKG